jgi:plasmid stabilization system protein ParE
MSARAIQRPQRGSVHRFVRPVRLLKDFPGAGRPGQLAGTREWVVRGLPYIIVYEEHADRNELHVLGVFYAAQKRPSGPMK